MTQYAVKQGERHKILIITCSTRQAVLAFSHDTALLFFLAAFTSDKLEFTCTFMRHEFPMALVKATQLTSLIHEML